MCFSTDPLAITKGNKVNSGVGSHWLTTTKYYISDISEPAVSPVMKLGMVVVYLSNKSWQTV